jgi:ABC-2 type transport system permease protein
MLRKVFAISRKELRLWLQVPGNWLTVFLVPLAFIGIFGSVFSKGTPVVTIFAVNADQGERGAEVIDLLNKSQNLEFEMLDTWEEADRLVNRGDRMAAVVIPENFSQAITSAEGASLLVIIDPARADQAGLVTGLVQEALIKPIVFAEIERAISGLFKDKQSVEGINANDFQLFINAGIKAVVSKSVNEAVDNPLILVDAKPYSERATQKEVSLFSAIAPGLAVVFAFFMVSHLASAVVDERSTGALRRLMTMPISKGALLAGKAIPFFFVAMVQITFVLIACNLIFNLPLGNSAAALALIIAATSLVIAGMGIFVAGLARNESQAGAVAVLVILVMGVISGSFMPQIKVEGIEMFTPNYWALEGIQNVIARGMGVEGVLLPAGILIGMAALFSIIGAVRFRYE